MVSRVTVEVQVWRDLNKEAEKKLRFQVRLLPDLFPVPNNNNQFTGSFWLNFLSRSPSGSTIYSRYRTPEPPPAQPGCISTTGSKSHVQCVSLGRNKPAQCWQLLIQSNRSTFVSAAAAFSVCSGMYLERHHRSDSFNKCVTAQHFVHACL